MSLEVFFPCKTIFSNLSIQTCKHNWDFIVLSHNHLISSSKNDWLCSESFTIRLFNTLLIKMWWLLKIWVIRLIWFIRLQWLWKTWVTMLWWVLKTWFIRLGIWLIGLTLYSIIISLWRISWNLVNHISWIHINNKSEDRKKLHAST